MATSGTITTKATKQAIQTGRIKERLMSQGNITAVRERKMSAQARVKRYNTYWGHNIEKV